MELRRTLKPAREKIAVLVLLLLAMAAVGLAFTRNFPALHSILDTAVFLLSGVLAFLLWDIGWRTGNSLQRFQAVCFAVVAAIKAAAPATSIIMLTGWDQRLVGSGEVHTEVIAILSKPPKLAELRQWLAECVGQPGD